MIKHKLLITYLTILFLGCHGRQSQLDFFNQNLIELKKDKTYQHVLKDSRDTLNYWIKTGIKANGIPPLRNETEFKFDEGIFFNKQKSRCIILILERNHSKTAKLDLIQLLFGNYENHGWNFYLESVPTIYFSRKMYNTTAPLSFSKLSELGRDVVIKEYYHKLSLKVNDDFFDYDLSILKEMHRDFLNDK